MSPKVHLRAVVVKSCCEEESMVRVSVLVTSDSFTTSNILPMFAIFWQFASFMVSWIQTCKRPTSLIDAFVPQLLVLSNISFYLVSWKCYRIQTSPLQTRLQKTYQSQREKLDWLLIRYISYLHKVKFRWKEKLYFTFAARMRQQSDLQVQCTNY